MFLKIKEAYNVLTSPPPVSRIPIANSVKDPFVEDYLKRSGCFDFDEDIWEASMQDHNAEDWENDYEDDVELYEDCSDDQQEPVSEKKKSTKDGKDSYKTAMKDVWKSL